MKYRYYRWNITANIDGDIIQASEFTFSQVVKVDTVTPPAPTALIAGDITSTSLKLSWTPSQDPSGIVSYEVFNGSISRGPTASPSIDINELTPSTNYSFTVIASDSAGNTSAASLPLIVRTGVRTDTVQVRSIRITTLGDTVDFQVGDTLTLTASVLPENASYKTVTWSVNDEGGSAVIDEKTGVLIAKKAGRITVEATATDSLGVSSLPFAIQIKADTVKVRSITISALSDTSDFKVGDTVRFRTNILPLNASNRFVTWTVSTETGTATIDTLGKLVAKSPGIVTVTAKSKDALGIISSEFILKIDPAIITEIIQNNSGTEIVISPNPSSGVFNIQTPTRNGSVQADVYNASGTLISSLTRSGNEDISLDLSGKMTGLYFLTLRSTNTVITKKLIIK
jgi:uncharacterized protein YjdB